MAALNAKTMTTTSAAYGIQRPDRLETFVTDVNNIKKNPDLMPCPRRPKKWAYRWFSITDENNIRKPERVFKVYIRNTNLQSFIKNESDRETQNEITIRHIICFRSRIVILKALQKIWIF